MSLSFKQLRWDYACPTQPQNPDCLPCLFLQFKQQGQDETNVVQIFSKQAVLMDALISTIVDELKRRASWSEPEMEANSLAARLDDGERYCSVLAICFSSSHVGFNARMTSPFLVAQVFLFQCWCNFLKHSCLS